MENKTQTEFHVKLHGIKLSEETEKKIEKDIQKIVMAELVNYMPPVVPGTDEPQVLMYLIPRGWLGIPAYLLNAKEIELGNIRLPVDAGFGGKGGYTAGP
ncbi:MAG TPA: hypothetical protein VFE53_11315 [Mucilaginibacter sp.]|jgi:hypothetical protein|nr:hypothetical protein [Mucilaginibacter sp.]